MRELEARASPYCLVATINRSQQQEFKYLRSMWCTVCRNITLCQSTVRVAEFILSGWSPVAGRRIDTACIRIRILDTSRCKSTYPEYRPSEVSGIRVPSADTNPFGGHARIRVRLQYPCDLCATGSDPEPLLVPPLPPPLPPSAPPSTQWVQCHTSPHPA